MHASIPGFSLKGTAEDYLHEAALADNPASGVHYDPAKDGLGLMSLGVHEHWNNPTEKLYSRNIGSQRNKSSLTPNIVLPAIDRFLPVETGDSIPIGARGMMQI